MSESKPGWTVDDAETAAIAQALAQAPTAADLAALNANVQMAARGFLAVWDHGIEPDAFVARLNEMRQALDALDAAHAKLEAAAKQEAQRG